MTELERHTAVTAPRSGEYLRQIECSDAGRLVLTEAELRHRMMIHHGNCTVGLVGAEKRAETFNKHECTEAQLKLRKAYCKRHMECLCRHELRANNDGILSYNTMPFRSD